MKGVLSYFRKGTLILTQAYFFILLGLRIKLNRSATHRSFFVFSKPSCHLLPYTGRPFFTFEYSASGKMYTCFFV
jgi:hypothetical protein